MNRQRLIVALYLIAATIGGYLCAPLMAELWIRILPVLRMGMMEELPVFGGSRWMAIGTILVVWQVVKPSPSRGALCKSIAMSLAGTVTCFQLSLLVLLSSDILMWTDPWELPFYPTPSTEFWTHFAAMPINLLITPFGGGIGALDNGKLHWTGGGIPYDPTDIPNSLTALVLGAALKLLVVLVAVPVLWKTVQAIGKKMGIDKTFDDVRRYRSVLRGWTALTLLPIYFNGSGYTSAGDIWGAYSDLQALGIVGALGFGATLVATPLFFLAVKKLRAIAN